MIPESKHEDLLIIPVVIHHELLLHEGLGAAVGEARR